MQFILSELPIAVVRADTVGPPSGELVLEAAAERIGLGTERAGPETGLCWRVGWSDESLVAGGAEKLFNSSVSQFKLSERRV